MNVTEILKRAAMSQPEPAHDQDTLDDLALLEVCGFEKSFLGSLNWLQIMNLAGRISRDLILWRRMVDKREFTPCAIPHSFRPKPCSCIPEGARAEVIAKMSDEERAALRARVIK